MIPQTIMFVIFFYISVEICSTARIAELKIFDVKECPQNQTQWNEAALKLNCHQDAHGQNTYHCVPNQDKSSLVEFCYNRLVGRFEKGYCLQLTKTLFLHSDNCQNILPGCPKESYLSNKIFKYADCQHINTDNRCYTLDQACLNETRAGEVTTKETTIKTIQRETTNINSNNLSTSSSTTLLIPYEDASLEYTNSLPISIPLGILLPFLVLIVLYVIYKKRPIRKRNEEDQLLNISDESVVASSLDKPGKTFSKNEDAGKTFSKNEDAGKTFSKREDAGKTFSKKEDELSPSLKRLKDLQCSTDTDEKLLFFLLCVHNCSADFKEEKTITLLKNSINLSNSEENYISLFRNLRSKDIVDINDSVVTFTTDDTMDRAVKYAYLHGDDKSTTEDKILDKWDIDVIKKYVRVKPYNYKPDEKCITFQKRCTEKLINRLKEDILTHPIVEDESCHKKIAASLEIPEEILKMDANYRKRCVQYLKQKKIQMYRARAMIVGCARAGKTTLVERLLKKSKAHIVKHKEFTVGLEVHDHVLIVDENNCLLKENDGASTSVMNEVKLLTLLDFAGQSAYYACHQVYLSHRAFYCLVVDMSKRLSDKIDPESCEPNGTIFENWTYKDYFVFWLKSIHTYCSRRSKGAGDEENDQSDVSVILIITHCEEKSDQEVEQFFYELTDCLPMHSKLKKYLNTNRLCSFSLDYQEDNDQQRKKLERIVIDTIKKQSHWGERIPAFWAEFEHIIEEKRKVQKLITLSQLRKESIKLGLQKDEDIFFLLRFFHEIGSILHFQETGLRETVILDIQWFVDAFKNVITDKKHVHNATSDRKEYERFVKSGELDSDVLLNIWREIKDCNFIKYKDYILPYMQRLGLLAVCKDQNRHTIYYVPCMNKKVMEETDMTKITDARKKTSVLVFKFRFLPYFVFYRLIVSCIEEFGYLNRDNDTCFYHKIAVFCYEDHYFAIAVTDNSIRVQIFKVALTVSKWKKNKLHPKVTLKIRECIEKMLKNLTQTFHSSLSYEVGYNCRGRDICEVDVGEEFIAERNLDNQKQECDCRNHGFSGSHFLSPKTLQKYWNKSRRPLSVY